MKVEKSVKKHR